MKAGNHLLNGLPQELKNLLLGQGCETPLEFGEVLCRAGDPSLNVYFPLSGFISQVAGLQHQKPLDVGMIGHEGMLGAPLILGTKTAPLSSIVLGQGVAFTLTVERFMPILLEQPVLANLLRHYVFVQLIQLTQANLCQCFHPVAARLARWLLMSHDRSRKHDFYLTHQFIADMLGVRRSAITIAAGKLQDMGVISYSRGTISVLSRKWLEKESCECYQADLLSYNQYIGLPMAV